MEKDFFRQEVIEKKASMDFHEITKKSDMIQNQLFDLPAYKEADSIFCYVSFNQEVRTFEIITHALEEGKRIYVPRIDQGYMKFIEITSLSELRTGYYGILEPELNVEVIPRHRNLIIVPGLAFDKAGRRIGYGKGFYDKYFRAYGVDKFNKVALCFEFQMYEELPVFHNDVNVNTILTEQGVYHVK